MSTGVVKIGGVVDDLHVQGVEQVAVVDQAIEVIVHVHGGVVSGGADEDRRPVLGGRDWAVARCPGHEILVLEVAGRHQRKAPVADGGGVVISHDAPNQLVGQDPGPRVSRQQTDVVRERGSRQGGNCKCLAGHTVGLIPDRHVGSRHAGIEQINVDILSAVGWIVVAADRHDVFAAVGLERDGVKETSLVAAVGAGQDSDLNLIVAADQGVGQHGDGRGRRLIDEPLAGSRKRRAGVIALAGIEGDHQGVDPVVDQHLGVVFVGRHLQLDVLEGGKGARVAIVGVGADRDAVGQKSAQGLASE